MGDKMVFGGLIIGATAFFLIGLGHPLVIKTEYYFGAKVWPVFLIAGIIACIVSLFIHNLVASAIVAIVGCTLIWSVRELKEQEERVKKGWFPANPAKKK